MKPYQLHFTERLSDLNPILVGEGTPTAEDSQRYSRGVYYLIHYVIAGKGIVNHAFGTCEVHKGQIYLTCPGELLNHRPDPEDPLHIRWVGFDGELASRFLTLPRVFDAPKGIMEQLCDLTNQDQNLHVLLASELLQLYAALFPKTPTNQGGTYVQQAVSYIQQNYMKPITVQGIADMLGLHRGYFSQIFRENTGYTPQQYILHFRLLQSRALLIRGLSIQEVAERSGFNNAASFCKIFKKYHNLGLTPLQFQRRSSGLLLDFTMETAEIHADNL